MKFCPECGNILLPKKGSTELFCRTCNKIIKVDVKKEKEALEQYKRTKKSKGKETEKKRALKTAVIEEPVKVKSMTEDEREAYGELFELTEE